MILAAVGALSLSSLTYELLITRFFSIAHGSHLSFLAVGVAMFGYAAGGTLHCLLEGKRANAESRGAPPLFAALLAACSLSTLGSYLGVKALPLDYLRFPVDRAQALYLLAAWLLLSVPFFACGLASVAAYTARPQSSGAIAAASLLGSAAGALAPALLLPIVEEGGCAAAAAAIPLVVLAGFGPSRALRACGILLLAAGAGFIAWQGGVLAVQPSPYKTLPLLRQAPGTAVLSRQSGLRGRLEEVESPSIRFAPGLSLSWEDDLPRQRGLVADGDALTVLYDLRGGRARRYAARFASWTHTFAPFELSTGAGDCLVLQQDGGLAPMCALASGARRIVLVVEDPRIARRTAQWYQGDRLEVFAENPRSYLGRAGQRFSVILIEDWGPSIPGLASLHADALLTVDSVRACWKRLEEGGVLAVSRRLVLPPSDSLRLFSNFLRALSEENVDDPAARLAVIRSWDSCTIMALRSPLAGTALRNLVSFAARRGFDLDYFPGMDPAASNRFSRYERPFYAEAYAALAHDAGYAGRQVLDIAPQDDDRPFPSHFVRWTHAADFYRATGERAYTLLLTGEIICGAVLMEVLALAAALLAATFLAGRARSGSRAPAGGSPPSGGPPPGRSPPGNARETAAFMALVGASGVGFMAAEMFVINALAPLFPSATVALSVALGGLLLFSALGGLASERLPRTALGPLLLLCASAFAAFRLLLPEAFSRALPLPFAVRIAAAVGLMAVAGFLIGIPFPAAMRLLPSGSRQRAEAWAVNGCGSVIVSAASALIAPAAGNGSLLVVAAAAYAAAGLVTAAVVDSVRGRSYYPGP